MSDPKPQRTTEELAAFLRREIQRRDEQIAGIRERRERVSNRFDAQRDAVTDEDEKARITARWSEALREKDAEIKIAEAERFAFRKTLQHLTGELWS